MFTAKAWYGILTSARDVFVLEKVSQGWRGSAAEIKVTPLKAVTNGRSNIADILLAVSLQSLLSEEELEAEEVESDLVSEPESTHVGRATSHLE